MLKLYKVGMDNKENANLLIKAGALYKDRLSEDYFTTDKTLNSFLYLCNKYKISHSLHRETVLLQRRTTGYILYKIVKNEETNKGNDFYVFNLNDIYSFFHSFPINIYMNGKRIIELENHINKPFKSFVIEDIDFIGKIKFRLNSIIKNYEITKLNTHKEDLNELITNSLKETYSDKHNKFVDAYEIAKNKYNFTTSLEFFKTNSSWLCPKCKKVVYQDNLENGFYRCKHCVCRYYIYNGRVIPTIKTMEVIDRVTKNRYADEFRKPTEGYGLTRHLICVKTSDPIRYKETNTYKNKEVIYLSGSIVFKDTLEPVSLDKEFLNSEWIDVEDEK